MNHLERGITLHNWPELYPAKDFASKPPTGQRTIYDRTTDTARNPNQFNVNYDTLEVTINGRTAKLTPVEFKLFNELYQKAPVLVDYPTLNLSLYGTHSPKNTVRRFIQTIRKKLEPDPAHPSMIISVSGRGYWLACGENVSVKITAGDLSLIMDTHRVIINGKEIHLTLLECELLKYFMEHQHQLLTYRQIGENIWYPQGKTWDKTTIKTSIMNLRHKIESDPSRLNYLHNVYNYGYLFEDQKNISNKLKGTTVRHFQTFAFDTERHEIIRNNQHIHLTPAEYEILFLLTKFPNRVLDYAVLMDIFDGGKNLKTYRQFIKSLRRKLGDLGKIPQIIINERGIGNMLVE